MSLSGCASFGDDGSSELPNRCINVVDQVLCETAGQQGKYIALSHRWLIETPSANTTRSNYNCRNRKCNHEITCEFQLTRLFREAIELTRKLGIQYIWIDSVCIIQDDDEDWQREALRMADYYQGAWLTIAATTTTEEGGLFQKYTSQDIPRVAKLPYRDKKGVHQGSFYLQCIGTEELSNQYEKNLASTLHRRGWVFQERLLSRRLLTLSRVGAFFNCRIGHPRFVTGEVLWRQWPRKELDIERVREDLRSMNISSQTSIIQKWWNDVIESYSILEITRMEGDRLMALAGLAKEFDLAFKNAHGEGSVFLSGHWFHLVHPGICESSLLWEQNDRFSSHFWRLRGIPTWSWASIARRQPGEAMRGLAVHWRRDTYASTTKPLCIITGIAPVSVDTTDWTLTSPQLDPQLDMHDWVSEDFGSRARFAALRIKGRLQKVLIRGFFDKHSEAIATARLTRCYDQDRIDVWRRVALDQSPNVVCGWASLDPSDVEQSQDLEALALFISEVDIEVVNLKVESFGEYATVFWVLFLVPAPGGNGEFHRLGVGRMFGDEVHCQYNSSEETEIALV